MTVTQAMLDAWGIDIDVFIGYYGEPTGLDDNGDPIWEGVVDDGNGIPDMIEDLVNQDPITTRPSKGGAYTDP